jgi:HAD superfamily hydrolase (TIGR01549 family)
LRARALLLDLDETLLDDNASYDVSVRRVGDQLAAAYPAFDFANLFDLYRRVSNDYWNEVAEAVMRGTMDGDAVRRESWRRALEQCGCGDTRLADLALESYARHRRESHALFEDAMPLLSSLPAGFGVAVITNGPSNIQWEKVHCTGLEKYVQHVLVSGDLGVAKPDPGIFRTALRRLGVAPEQAVHVGDSLYADVGGANAAGLSSVWLNRYAAQRDPDDAAPDHEITSLSELSALLAL